MSHKLFRIDSSNDYFLRRSVYQLSDMSVFFLRDLYMDNYIFLTVLLNFHFFYVQCFIR